MTNVTDAELNAAQTCDNEPKCNCAKPCKSVHCLSEAIKGSTASLNFARQNRVMMGIKCSCRALSSASMRNTNCGSLKASRILRFWLEIDERTLLARAALMSLPEHRASAIIEESIGYLPSFPIAPLFNFFDEAKFWAAMASPRELEAYCWACFQAMSAKRQADFLKCVTGKTTERSIFER